MATRIVRRARPMCQPAAGARDPSTGAPLARRIEVTITSVIGHSVCAGVWADEVQIHCSRDYPYGMPHHALDEIDRWIAGPGQWEICHRLGGQAPEWREVTS